MKLLKQATLVLFTMCVMILCTVFCAANVSAAEIVDSGECGDNLTWVLYDDGELIIEGTGDMWNWGAAPSAPWYNYGNSITKIKISNGVTSIGNSAFRNCTKFTRISIPDSVTSLGKYAFYSCTVLPSISISQNVTFIGDNAFAHCYGLTSITVDSRNPSYCSDTAGALFDKETTTLIQYPCSNPQSSYSIPKGVTSISQYAFYGCQNLTAIDIPNSVVSIGAYAFSCCYKLTNIIIPSGVAKIDGHAFDSCTKLSSVTIENGVPTIGASAFFYCTSLTSISIPESVIKIEDSAFKSCTSLTSISIPDSVTEIGVSAFSGCDSLTNVNIGNSVTSIGRYAFESCTSLASITIPESVTEIGDSAFYGCKLLTRVPVFSLNVSFGSNVFKNTRNTLTLYGYTESTTKTYAEENGCKFVDLSINPEIPEREIAASGTCGDNLSWVLYDTGDFLIEGTGAMPNCRNAKNTPWYSEKDHILNVSIGNGITSIGTYAFCDCSILTNITIPDSVTEIGYYAFQNCSKLTNITLPKSVLSIGSYAFSQCYRLTSVFIPDSVTSIGTNAFRSCINLTNITVDPNNPNYSSDAAGVLFNKDKTLLIRYPNGKTETSYTIPNGVTSIGTYAFDDCRKLTSVIVPDGVTSIGDSAFHSCKVTSIILPKSITYIGEDAFYSNALTSITIPENTTYIGDNAFDYCSNLASVTVLSKDVKFDSNVFFQYIPNNFTLYGYEGSTTEVYASFNGYNFVVLPSFLPGDITGDSSIDITDVIALFRYSMMPDMYPISYAGEVDFTGDGSVDIADVIALFRHSMMPDLYPLT